MKIRGKLRRERCRRPRGKSRTGIGERPLHDPMSALQWRRSRLRCVRPRSKAAGDVRCTKSIMRVTMATARTASHRCRAAASIYDMEGAFVIHRPSFKRPSGLIEHERNSGRDHDRDSSQGNLSGESIISTLSVNSHLIANYCPQMKSESAAICRDHLTWTTMDHVSFHERLRLDGTASGLLRDASIRSTGGDTIGDKVA